MAEVIILQISKDELRELIRNTLQEILEGNKPIIQIDEDEPLLKVDEVCKVLSVSKVTIHKWKKKGRIPYHRISNRIFFKKSEILESMKKVDMAKIFG